MQVEKNYSNNVTKVLYCTRKENSLNIKQDGRTTPQLFLFLIGGETAINIDFLLPQIVHKYRIFLTRNPGSFGLDQLISSRV
jgi:hypothetical protein